ncbi:hypothetical protein Syun_018299 [Stephania yunnanensis]|uniref:Uncharacterized protein n=1 Tax=Stephania yunnanensis TaxID=152371 RepID=A0AAP0NUW3_9MAGN
MEEEEEDRILLHTLGITSANPEDIERDLLKESGNDTQVGDSAGGSAGEQLFEDEKCSDPPSSWSKLYSKLRAVEIEMNAVAASIEQASAAENDQASDTTANGLEGHNDANGSASQGPSNGLTIQCALATDRLRSLKKTKSKLQKELKELEDIDGHDKLIKDLVREEVKPKRKLKEIQNPGKDSKKGRKRVSLEDDSDFDAMLDAASGGFIETERDELVRKGILTPFHKLKGFERRVHQPGPSKSLPEGENKTEDIFSATVAKVVRSISEAAQSRATTKLVDAKNLPKLEAPSHPFHRLKTPVKLQNSAETEPVKSKDKTNKRKRPLADKKWRKAISREEKLSEGSAIFSPLKEEMGDISVTSDNDEEHQVDEAADDTESSDVTLEGGLKIPDFIYGKLFDYQKVGVQWMWELHCQRAGGIIGDEMGLGKTIQVLAFLGSLHFSNMYQPSIVICPATLLRQWKREARKWYPKFRVAILHDSAHLNYRKKTDDSDESGDEIERLLITTYEQLRLLGEKLLDIEWGYAVLDEGHRIRNPNAEVTLVCKQLQTVHRIIMTGAPIQNKLTELWSLFDFVFPGKLGVLPIFEAEFAVPISVGGYANATPLQVSTAYSLTAEQRSVYRAFLASSEVEQIFDGNRNSLYGIDIMRKICNHPDLLEREHASHNPEYGNPERSGKMKVVAEVLKVWKDQGHKVLLFSQTQQMLDILEGFLQSHEYIYRRMDGLTPVKQRMALIDEFNNSNDIFIFILTTKVGGLGTNLTGANRVIIFDPDWNPSTDMQARERAWRIGQTRDVIVYRLITRGTIEEKVYHRQIYKHFLTNKILKNPQQRRFFKARDMKDLFTLQDDLEGGSTETSNIFGQLSGEMSVIEAHKNGEDKQKSLSVAAKSPNISDAGCANDNNTTLRQSESNGKEETDSKGDEETDILKSLFDARGIHSAINHDMIMNAHSEEKIRLEEQASQVAQRAAEALRKSRMLRSRDSISVPTWTGRSGAAGAPSSVSKKFGSTVNSQLIGTSKPSDGASSSGSSRPNGFAAGVSMGKALSSSELLSRIRGTQERAVADGLEHQFNTISGSNSANRPENGTPSRSSRNPTAMPPEVLIRQICTFLQQNGGTTSSAGIVQYFKDKIPSKDLTLFKSLLKEIATLEKSPSGSSWVLKPEYQQT